VKRLFLLRHAKSDWDADYSGDHERPLSKRGLKAAKKIGRYLSETSRRPEAILSSSSVRTTQTIDIVKENAGWDDAQVQFEDDLYLAAPSTALGLIRELPDSCSSAMLVGHQPFTGILASSLLGGVRIEVPTACLIVMDLDIKSWSEVSNVRGRLIEHILPRQLD